MWCSIPYERQWSTMLASGSGALITPRSINEANGVRPFLLPSSLLLARRKRMKAWQEARPDPKGSSNYRLSSSTITPGSGIVNTHSDERQKAFTFAQNHCSRSFRISVHGRPEWVFTLPQNMHMTTDFVLDALEQALYARHSGDGQSLIHHRDRGSQYVSIRYSERLKEAGIEPSVGSTGDSYERVAWPRAIMRLPRRSTACTRPR